MLNNDNETFVVVFLEVGKQGRVTSCREVPYKTEKRCELVGGEETALEHLFVLLADRVPVPHPPKKLFFVGSEVFSFYGCVIIQRQQRAPV